MLVAIKSERHKRRCSPTHVDRTASRARAVQGNQLKSRALIRPFPTPTHSARRLSAPADIYAQLAIQEWPPTRPLIARLAHLDFRASSSSLSRYFCRLDSSSTFPPSSSLERKSGRFAKIPSRGPSGRLCRIPAGPH